MYCLFTLVIVKWTGRWAAAQQHERGSQHITVWVKVKIQNSRHDSYEYVLLLHHLKVEKLQVEPKHKLRTVCILKCLNSTGI